MIRAKSMQALALRNKTQTVRDIGDIIAAMLAAEDDTSTQLEGAQALRDTLARGGTFHQIVPITPLITSR